MYPFFRLAKEMFKFRNAPRLGPFDAHVSTHRIWPWDLDPWRELNNGRTLTLFDLGRLPLFARIGIVKGVAQQGWGLTVAGNTTRYRRRLTVFQMVTMVSRCIGWDDRFFYLEQSFWRGDECTSHMLLRAAVFTKGGIIAPAQATSTLGISGESAPLPDWVQGWILAEGARPWPPQR